MPDVPLSVTRMPLMPLPEMTFYVAVLEAPTGFARRWCC